MSEVREGVPSFTARRYVDIVKRRRLVVVALTLLGLAAALAYLLTTPAAATATTQVNVNPISANPFDTQRAASTVLDPATEQQLVTSSDVTKTVSEKLGGRSTQSEVRNGTQATLLPGSTIMRIKFRADTVQDARLGADTLAKAYLDFRTVQADAVQASVNDRLEARRESLRRDLESVNRTIANGRTGSSRVNFAQSERQLILIELNSLFSRLNDVAGVDTTGGSVVASAASNPVVVTPSTKRILVTGGLAGLLLGLIAAFVLNALDRRLWDGYDAAQAEAGPILGRLPSRRSELPASGPDRDDLRVVRERVLALLGTSGSVVTVIDDTDSGTGSDVGANLALVLAEARSDVRLVLPGVDDGFLQDLVVRLDLVGPLPESLGEVYESRRVRGLTVSRPDAESAAVASPVAADGASGHGRLTVVALPSTASHAARLTAGRVADAVVLVAVDGGVKKTDIAEVAAELRAVGSAVDGLVLVSHRRSLVPVEVPATSTQSRRHEPAETSPR